MKGRCGRGVRAILAYPLLLATCAAPGPLGRDLIPGPVPGDAPSSEVDLADTPIPETGVSADLPPQPELPGRDEPLPGDSGDDPQWDETAPEGPRDPDPGEAVPDRPDQESGPGDPGPDADAPLPPVTREEVLAVAAACDRDALKDFLDRRYDGPVCDEQGCALITVPGGREATIRGEFNAWGETPMTPLPCLPGAFLAQVPLVPTDADAWQYRLFVDGAWQDDPNNRWVRFSDLAVNQAMHRDGTSRIARLTEVWSPELGNRRDIYVFVPAEAFSDRGRRFPVMLLQDGWNVFENPRAPFGSWKVDRTAQDLVRQGAIEPVVLVGVTTSDRINEYLYTDFWVSGGGTPTQVNPRLPAYGEFLVHTLLPRIRSEFPVREGPADTAIGGSSLGGISAFWIAWKHPEVFGKVAALSPSFWVGEEGSGTEEKPSMREVMSLDPLTPARRALRIYLDSGDSGYAPGGGDLPPYAQDGRAYTDWTRNALIRMGWPNRPEWDTDSDLSTAPADLPLSTVPGMVPVLPWSETPPPGYGDWREYLRPNLSLLHLVGLGHLHNEADWERRFPAVLRFLFPAQDKELLRDRE